MLNETSAWAKFTKKEKSALATALLESVESATLAALLTSPENASQIVSTQQLGNRRDCRAEPGLGAALEGDLGRESLCRFSGDSFLTCPQILNPQQGSLVTLTALPTGGAFGKVRPSAGHGQTPTDSWHTAGDPMPTAAYVATAPQQRRGLQTTSRHARLEASQPTSDSACWDASFRCGDS